MPAETLDESEAFENCTSSTRLLYPHQIVCLKDPSKRKVGMAGRRGGKTVWEIAEVGVTCIDEGGFCGWGAPNFPILRDAWRDIKAEFADHITEVRESEWTINFNGGGRLECWSLDSGIVARGRKYHKFIIDEAGVVSNLGLRFSAEIEPTLGQYDGTLIAGSTPNLVGPDLLLWFNMGQRAGTGWKSWRWSSLDNPAVAANMAKLIASARSRGVPDWIIRQEYFAEPAESDRAFFRSADIELHKRLHVRDPIERGMLDVGGNWQHDRFSVLRRRVRERLAWLVDTVGPWRVWGKYDPSDNYCIGVDLAYGVGSSNTVFSVGRKSERRKIAEYAWPGVTPDEAAMLAAAAGVWYSGPNGPASICFERNGPGEVFAKRMHELVYPSLWYERKEPSKIDHGAVKENRYGWDNNPKSREYVLGAYRAALGDNRFINPCAAALDECLTYQYDDQMRITSPFDRTKAKDDPARVKHGDRVIADALLCLCFDWTADPPVHVETEWAPNTYGAALGHEHPNANAAKPVKWGGL